MQTNTKQFQPSLGSSPPSNLDSLSANGHAEPLGEESHTLIAYRGYREKVSQRYIKLEHIDPESGNIVTLVISGPAVSRYFEPGREGIKRKLGKRLPWQAKKSVLFTGTFDQQRFPTLEASFQEIWPAFRRFRKRLRQWRQRQGWVASPGYLAIIEQHKNGHPHLHVAYPGLHYLAPYDKLNDWWDVGYCHIEGGKAQSVSPLSYLLKYITKVNGWSELGLAHLYTTKTRLYNISQKLYQPIPAREPSSWSLVAVGKHADWSAVSMSEDGLVLGEEVLINVGDGAYLGPSGKWKSFNDSD